MDVEFKILSDSRDGLLKELGILVGRHGFSLLHQRISTVEDGVQLTLRVKGSAAKLLTLEDQLASHPRVLGFESNHDIPASAVPAEDRRTRIQPESGAETRASASKQRESARSYIEAQLPGLAKLYPRIFPRLINMLSKLPDEHKAASMKLAGRRVGAWVYKRDYAFGGRLDFHGVLKQIALPVLSELMPTELVDHELHVEGCPLCNRSSNGDFFCGMLEGILQEAGVGEGSLVRETFCRSEGHKYCVFEALPG